MPTRTDLTHLNCYAVGLFMFPFILANSVFLFTHSVKCPLAAMFNNNNDNNNNNNNNNNDNNNNNNNNNNNKGQLRVKDLLRSSAFPRWPLVAP